MARTIQNTHITTTVIEVRHASREILEISVARPPDFAFKAGQYAWVIVLNQRGDEIGRRALSIASAPGVIENLSFIIRTGNSNFKKSVSRLAPGERIILDGPYGSSFVPDSRQRTHVFLAGGTGIAPFLSILRQEKYQPSRNTFHLIYAEEKSHSILHREELESLANDRVHISFVPRITSIQQLSGAVYYVSGPQGFVNFIHTALDTKKIPSAQIRYEGCYPNTSLTSPLQALFEDGKVVQISKISKAAQEQIQLLSNIINSSSSHLIVTDINGTILFANESAQKITGFTFAEMQGNTPRLWGGLMDEQFYKEFWKNKKLGLNFSNHITNRRKNGDLYIANARIAPIYFNNKLIGWIGSEDDITEVESRRKKAEAQNKELTDSRKAMLNVLEDIEEEKKNSERQKNKLELAQKSAKIGIWEWDVIKNIITWDDRMYDLYGISKKDFGGAYEAWQAGLHPDDKKPGDEAIQKALTGEKEFDTTFRVIWPDKSIHYIKAYGIVERDEKGKPLRMIGTNWDITQEKEIDRAKSEFVSLASHQLKTPVGAVKWDAEMLLSGDYGKLTKEQREVVTEIYEMNKRMNDIVKDFLNLSRIELGTFMIEPTPVIYADVCKDVLTELRQRIEAKQHTVKTDFQKNMPEMVADPHMLRIIFQNLLSNAVKYTPEHGRIGVAIGTDKQRVWIRVSNNGIPISPDEQKKLFTKMYRTEKAQTIDPDGNGLGLYLLKQIVQAAGGDITFTSTAGQDTVFSVTFPLPGMKRRQGTKSLS